MMPESTHPHKSCLDLFNKLSEYLDNELEASVCRSIERHLADCQACQVCVATLKRTMALCRESASAPVPKEMSKRLKDLIRQLQQS